MAVDIEELPNELFALIFKSAATDFCKPDDQSEIFATPRPDIRTLLSLSQVCRRWRQIALSDGELWGAAINLDSYLTVRGVEEMAARTGLNAPLDIYSRKRWQEYNTKAWDFVFANLHNWRTFTNYTVLGESRWQPLVKALGQPMPLLEAFVLHNVRWQDPEEVSRDTPCVLPSDLFAGHAPRLRVFSIRSVYMGPSFDFSLWKHLTALHVDQDNIRYPYKRNRLFAYQWLEILAGMDQLEHLDLRWKSDFAHRAFSGLDPPADLEDFVDHLPDVHLRNLLSLRFSLNHQVFLMLDLFRKLVVPDTCNVSIDVDTLQDIYRERFSADEFQVGLDRLIAGWRARGIGDHLAMRVCNRSDRGLFRFSCEIHSVDKAIPGPTFRLSCIDDDITGHVLEAIIRDCKDTSYTKDSDTEDAKTNTAAGLLRVLGNVASTTDNLTLSLELCNIIPRNRYAVRRFLKECKNATQVTFIDPNSKNLCILLEILQRNVLEPYVPWTPLPSHPSHLGEDCSSVLFLPNLRSLHFTVWDDRAQAATDEFRSWRESIGRLPESFNVRYVLSRYKCHGGD